MKQKATLLVEQYVGMKKIPKDAVAFM